MESTEERARPRMPRWATCGALVVALPAAIWLVANAVGSSRQRAAARRFEAVAGSRADLLARHPAAPTNDAARRIERLAGALGVDMAPKTSSSQGSSLPIRRAIGTHLEAMLAAEVGAPEPAPAEIAAWIEQHEAALDELVAVLASGDRPAWEVNASAGFGAPIPNLLGHVTLEKLLLVVALERSRLGRTGDADEALEAGWRLAESLEDRPELISHLVRVACVKWHAGALRKVPTAGAAAWQGRLAALDLRAGLRESVAAEAWAMDRIASDGRALAEHSAGGSPVTAGGRVGATLALPLARMAMAPVLDGKAALLRADAASAPCPPTESTLATAAPKPSWNPVVGALDASLSPSLLRTYRGLFDVELTSAILRARADRAPSRQQGSCPNWTFVTEIQGDGRLAVTVDGVPPPDASSGLVLPVSWIEPAPPGGAEGR